MPVAHPWMRTPHCSLRGSSRTIALSTTSTRTGSPASPSSSAPQGAPPCRPSRCLALHSTQEARIRKCLHHLLPKEAPWLQGAQPQGKTLRVRRLCSKKGAAKRSLVPKKVFARSERRRAQIASLHLHAKTPRCSKRRRAVIPRSKPSTSKRHGGHSRLPCPHPRAMRRRMARQVQA